LRRGAETRRSGSPRRPGDRHSREEPMANHSLARGQQGLAAWTVLRRALLACHGGRQAADRLADRGGLLRRQAALLLEPPRAEDVAGEDGGIRPPALLGGAVPRGGEDAAGVGPVSGAVVAGVPPPRGVRHAGVQLPGLAGVQTKRDAEPTWQAAPAFFPLGPTAGAYLCRRSTAASATGCGLRPA